MFYTDIECFGFSLYEMCLLFVAWAFIGWAVEVCVHALKMGEYSNRGFLSMPICPIYGFGVLIITVLLRAVIGSPLAVFFLSSLICTSFELAVGVAMKAIFHNMWWDYTDEHFNFKGFICLKVSIEWGFGCLIVEYLAEPWIESVIGMLPVHFGTFFIVLMTVLITFDLVNSVNAACRLNLRLREISDISEKMYRYSQIIGKKFADTALDTADKGAEVAADIYLFREETEDYVEELTERVKNEAEEKAEDIAEKLRARYDALIAFSDISDRRAMRLLSAFPSLRSVDYGDELEKMKTALKSRIREKMAKK